MKHSVSTWVYVYCNVDFIAINVDAEKDYININFSRVDFDSPYEACIYRKIIFRSIRNRRLRNKRKFVVLRRCE